MNSPALLVKVNQQERGPPATTPQPLKILNLYAGIGGNRKLWSPEYQVTAVEADPEIAAVYQELYPQDEVIVGDAHAHLEQHFRDYDFIWSSPPCTSHSRLRTMLPKKIYPDMRLYQEIIFLKKWARDTKFVIENVVPYYRPLIEPAARLGRHLVWTNFPVDTERYTPPQTTFTHIMSKPDRLTEYHGIRLPERTKRKALLLRNAVHPELGKFLLDQAIQDDSTSTAAPLKGAGS